MQKLQIKIAAHLKAKSYYIENNFLRTDSVSWRSADDTKIMKPST